MTAQAIRLPGPDQPVARAVAVSTATQLGMRAFDLLANVVVSLAVLRHLGPTSYGDYVLVMTVSGLVGLVSELGLPKLSVREVARAHETAGSIVGTVTCTRLGLSVIACGAAQIALLALGADAEVHIATLIASSMFFAEALLSIVVVFHVTMRQQYEAFARSLANLVKLVLVLVLTARGFTLLPLVAATTVTLLVASAVAWLIALRGFRLRPSVTPARVRPLLRMALPVWPALLAGVFYLKLDALMVALLGSRDDVGIYGAAYQPVEYLLLGSALFLNVLFPLAARAHSSPGDRFDRVYRRGSDVLLAATLPVAMILAISATHLTTSAYEQRFEAAAGPMALLGIALVFLALNAWQALVLLAADRPGVNVRCLAVALGVNIAVDLVLVPALGPIGAAWGTLISAVLLFALSTVAVSRIASAHLDPSSTARIVIAAGAFAGVLGVLQRSGVNWLLAIVLAAASYPAWLFASRAVRPDDLRALRSRPPGDVDALAGNAA